MALGTLGQIPQRALVTVWAHNTFVEGIEYPMEQLPEGIGLVCERCREVAEILPIQFISYTYSVYVDSQMVQKIQLHWYKYSIKKILQLEHHGLFCYTETRLHIYGVQLHKTPCCRRCPTGWLLQVLGMSHFIQTSAPPFPGFPFQLANIMYVYTLNIYIAS